MAYASLGALDLGTGQYTVQTDGSLPTLRDAANQLLATGWYVTQADAFNPQVAVFNFDSIRLSGDDTRAHAEHIERVRNHG